MSMCSYETLARLEGCSPTSCVGLYLDDVRERQREVLHERRYKGRTLKMLTNRQTLAKIVVGDDFNDAFSDCDTYSENSINQASHDFYEQNYVIGTQRPTDYGAQHSSPASTWDSLTITPSTDDWSCSHPSPAPSTSDWLSSNSDRSSSPWSSGSERTISNHPVLITESNVPRYFLEDIPPSRLTGSKGKSNKSPSGSTGSKNHMRNLSATSKTKLHCDDQQILKDLNTFKEAITRCPGDAVKITNLVQNYWLILSDAIKYLDEAVVIDTINTISQLAAEHLLSPESVLHMLQNGLIFNLRDSLWKIGDDGYITVLDLLLNILHCTPACLPYMMDLMSKTGIFDEFNNRLMESSMDCARALPKFYHYIMETTMSQLLIDNQSTTIQPLIPDILRVTGLSAQTVESYGPVATMKKIITVSLVENIVCRCLDRANQRDEDTIQKTFIVLANVLQFIHLLSTNPSPNSDDKQWAAKLLKAFRGSNIERQIGELNRGLERLIMMAESSEHCSQGVGTGAMASRVLDICRQFATFYTEHHTRLMAHFGI